MEKSIDGSVREGPDIASPMSPVAFADNGIALIPQPSDDPEDPLNWTLFRKGRVLFVICLASFAGNVAALAGQEAYPLQSKVYNVTVIESSYSVAAAMSGLATGAFFFVPLGHIVGRWSITFWSLLACLACGVWSACMTRESDYNNFIVSRLFSGLFGAVPSAVGGGMILDIFFLHQRGRAFICYEIAILFGATAGPTFSGFIAGTASWTWCFWWTVPFLAVTALLVFFCAEETSYNRDGMPMQRSQGFVKSRMDTFFPGTAVVTIPPGSEIIKSAVAPFAIGLSPATVLCGLFTLVVFGWLLINDVLSPTFLQNPIEEGGYGFTPVQNAAFSMAGWVAIITSQVVGMFAHDGLPLWICKRFYNGVWRPELRLYVMGITAVFVPVGLGICGAALKQHYHYMVFALGYYIVAVAVLIAVPVATNYVAESYTEHGTECTLVMTFYRLAWGVAIPFFITNWIEEVGIAWVYGTAAFVTVGAWLLIQALLWKGPTLRQWSLAKSLLRSEEGQKLFAK